MTKKKTSASGPGGTATRSVKIQNKYGIHARPAALFVKTAAKYESEITVEKDGVTVSAKSIMGLLTLEGYQGAVLKLSAVGVDAEKALEDLAGLVEQKFFED